MSFLNYKILLGLESYYKVDLFSVVVRYDHTIDFCTTQSISVLHNRYLYYTIDFCTTQSISVLHNRFLYYTIDICTTQSISVLHNRSLYYTIDFCTTQSISVLHNRFLYYTIDTGVTQSISVWRNRFLHYIEVVCFGTKKLCTGSYIKIVVFELQNSTWLGIVLQGWFV